MNFFDPPRSKSLICFFSMVAIFTTAGCFRQPDLREAEAQASPPLSKVHWIGSDMIVYPAEKVHIEDLVDMEIFKGLKPGMSFSEAERVLGNPIQEGQGRRGPFKAFQRPEGRVVVAREVERSGSASREIWRLTAYPEPSSLKHLVHPEVVQYFQKDPRHEIVFMSSFRGSPGLQVSVQNNSIQSMSWLWSNRPIDWDSDKRLQKPTPSTS